MGIGTRKEYSEVPLAIGNVLSNGKLLPSSIIPPQLTNILEPGYYEDGKFGIRIENVMMCKEVQTNHKFGDKPWLGFEHVTMVPLCRKLIDPSLLTLREKKWINNYHLEVHTKTNSFFQDDEKTMKWLERETAPI